MSVLATRRPAGAISDVELCAWIAQAEPGAWLEYHRGFLVIDAMAGISKLPEPDRRRLEALAAGAHRAFHEGLVHLVQVRIGPDCFAYVAIARPRPAAAPVRLNTLLAMSEAA